MKKPLSRPIHKPSGPRPEMLARLTAEGLSFLAADNERLERFFTITGLSVGELRAAAGRSGFAESLIDYLAADERTYVAFAEASGYSLPELEAIRMSLGPPSFDP